MAALAEEAPSAHDLVMDWSWEGDESDEEAKLRAETRKILELPDLPLAATCVRVPVMVGHSEAVWVELEEPLAPGDAAELLRAAPESGCSTSPSSPPRARQRAPTRCSWVGSGRDTAAANGLALYLSCDNLRKGAALNAIQIAETLLSRVAGLPGRA